MSDSKIQIKIGIVEFSGEGQQDWLASQLDKILEKVPELVKMELTAPQNNSIDDKGSLNNGLNISKLPTLSIWLRDKNATLVQTRKFLATAVHLQLGGKQRITTTDVNAAIKNANQTKLNNSSESLNQNVSKGFCEKDANGFFVTEHGLNEFGVN